MKVISFLPAIIWFIISFILLTLPGNDLPHEGFFNLPNFDKYVHFGMFFLLTALFCFPFIKSKTGYLSLFRLFNKIALYVILYGISMEFVQKYFAVGRSFDLFDILFDSLGSIAGLITVRQYSFKKIGPNGNRGRNQN